MWGTRVVSSLGTKLIWTVITGRATRMMILGRTTWVSLLNMRGRGAPRVTLMILWGIAWMSLMILWRTNGRILMILRMAWWQRMSHH